MAHILIIDDDPDVRRILEKLLTRWHLVETAENGTVGIKLLSSLYYDLVITDIVMPDRDGLEVIRELGSVSPGTRVIAMTGGTAKLSRDNLLSMARLMKADRVIAKPFDFVQLERAIHGLLEAGT